MKIYSLLLLLIFISFISCVLDNSNSRSNKSLNSDKIDSIAQQYINTGQVQGFTIAIRKNDSLIYNKGFGLADSSGIHPVTNEHYFNLASISKLVGATLVMKLVEEGKLSLKDRLIDMLPDYPNKEHAEKITLTHLLAHTSGLQDYAQKLDPIYVETGIPPTRNDYYQFFATHDLLFEPGELYRYSNSGYALLAMIVERVTERSFQQEIDRVINDPTGLDIRLIAERLDEPLLTDEFELVDSNLVYREHWSWFLGDGGLSASAKDLSRFPFLWSNGTMISENSWKTMIEPTTLNNGIQTGYGLGVRTGTFEGSSTFGHTGGENSFHAVMMFLPEEKMSIVIMVNTDNTPADAVAIFGPVALAALGKKWPVPKENEIKNADLSVYEGRFLRYRYKDQIPDTFISYINQEDGHLYMKSTSNKSKGLKYYYLGDHSFTYESYPMDRVVFEFNQDGEVAAFKNYWNGFFQRMAFSESYINSLN